MSTKQVSVSAQIALLLLLVVALIVSICSADETPRHWPAHHQNHPTSNEQGHGDDHHHSGHHHSGHHQYGNHHQYWHPAENDRQHSYESCLGDFQQFCSHDLEFTKENVFSSGCLMLRWHELTPDCRSALKQHYERQSLGAKLRYLTEYISERPVITVLVILASIGTLLVAVVSCLCLMRKCILCRLRRAAAEDDDDELDEELAECCKKGKRKHDKKNKKNKKNNKNKNSGASSKLYDSFYNTDKESSMTATNDASNNPMDSQAMMQTMQIAVPVPVQGYDGMYYALPAYDPGTMALPIYQPSAPILPEDSSINGDDPAEE